MRARERRDGREAPRCFIGPRGRVKVVLIPGESLRGSVAWCPSLVIGIPVGRKLRHSHLIQVGLLNTLGEKRKRRRERKRGEDRERERSVDDV